MAGLENTSTPAAKMWEGEVDWTHYFMNIYLIIMNT